jgi:hypothetical protein
MYWRPSLCDHPAKLHVSPKSFCALLDDNTHYRASAANRLFFATNLVVERHLRIGHRYVVIALGRKADRVIERDPSRIEVNVEIVVA